MLWSLLLHVFIEECGSTLSTVVPVVVLRHEATDSGNRRVLPQPDNLSTILNSVIFEGLERNGLVDTLRLLGLGVDLFLPLLSSSTETEYQVKGRLLLDIVIRESASILKLLPSKDETLLIGRDSFLVLDLGLDIVNCIRGLNIKRDGLACQT